MFSDSNALLTNVPNVDNLVDLLLWRSTQEPGKKAYTFLEDGENESLSLTYYELDSQARKIATQLQILGMSGERALLLYNAGLEFIVAFFGCLYARVIPVPIYPPRRNQNLSRLLDIVTDAGARLALTTPSVWENIDKKLSQLPQLANVYWLTSEPESGLLSFHTISSDKNEQSFQLPDIENLQAKISSDMLESRWQKPQLQGNNLAFLQYTSGSTSKPKGVMVSHENLLVNSQDLDRGWKHDENSVIVTWLPTFHDLGLIYGVLQPLYRGIPCYMMAPVTFLQSPVRWLKAITKYKGTHSGSPNFAYELCCRKVKDEQKQDLDLSSWKMALNGAEPVRVETLKKFTQKFAECNFNSKTFCPGYGLAEATLKVTAVRSRDNYQLLRVKSSVLRNNQVMVVDSSEEDSQVLVGSGYTEIDTKIKIVNTNDLTECLPDQVGEIWVSGKTVAQGYWQNEEKTQETFLAHIQGNQDDNFLRTGDLGFKYNGELFVTGRLKDVIIITGKNHYPQDIEETVENSHEAIIFSHSAAFAIQVEGEDKLVIIAEVERRYRNRRKSTSPPRNQVPERRKKSDRRQNSDPVDQSFAQELQNPPIFPNIIKSIRQEVGKNHGLQAYRVVLIRFGTIPKTSSGKIQRYACRQAIERYDRDQIEDGDFIVLFDSKEMKDLN